MQRDRLQEQNHWRLRHGIKGSSEDSSVNCCDEPYFAGKILARINGVLRLVEAN